MTLLRSFVLFLGVLILAGCGPQLQLPTVSQALIEKEREQQREMALKLRMERGERLFRISSLLRTRGVELCGTEIEPFFGLIWADRDMVQEDYRDTASRLFRLGDNLVILSVLPDFPASQSGLKPGDVVVKVGGTPVADLSMSWFSQTSKAKRAIELLREVGNKPVNLEIQRSGETLSLTLKPQAACRYDTHLVEGDKVNAFTDGEQVGITTGMVRFANNDDELALVLGHEYAHNVLDHKSRRTGNVVVGTILGALLDIGLAAAGVNTGGAGMRAGAEAGGLVYSQAFEIEADYLGLYFAARAGVDISKAPDFFRRMGIEHPGSIRENFLATHPSSPERAAAMEAVVQEIQQKLKSGEALVPVKIKEITTSSGTSREDEDRQPSRD